MAFIYIFMNYVKSASVDAYGGQLISVVCVCCAYMHRYASRSGHWRRINSRLPSVPVEQTVQV